MHPTIPELDGKIMYDPYVDYLWPKPTRDGLTADQPIISYVQLFKEWNWVVGTGVYKAGGRVCIEIEDNGPGMDEATRRRIFEPFFTTKPTDRSTGLGLSVSYFIITENHNGEMRVESTPGAGSKFIIRLPLERKHG